MKDSQAILTNSIEDCLRVVVDGNTAKEPLLLEFHPLNEIYTKTGIGVVVWHHNSKITISVGFEECLNATYEGENLAVGAVKTAEMVLKIASAAAVDLTSILKPTTVDMANAFEHMGPRLDHVRTRRLSEIAMKAMKAKIKKIEEEKEENEPVEVARRKLLEVYRSIIEGRK